MKVPLLDLTRQYQQLKDEIEPQVLSVLQSGWYILGPQVEAFEKETAGYIGSEYAVGLNSGTDALRIALSALNIDPGDEVITSAFSYFATCEVISEIGASVVFCDIDPHTFNIDPDDFARKITSKTKAVIPVHIFGQLCEMDRIMVIARDRGIPVIEDACQAIGAAGPPGKAGSIADIGTFSFFPSKNLGAVGDGGLLTTNDPDIDAIARSLRMHGTRNDRYRHETLGYNSRLDELQAAILRIKLRYLDEFNEKRRTHASAYNEIFNEIDGIEPPVELPDYKHIYHQYTVRITGGKRDAVFESLKAEEIGCAIYYKVPLHKQPAYNGKFDNIHLPVAEKAAEEVLSLPVFPEMTVEERGMVIDAVIKAVK
ncbi:hypothetical protein DRQ36_01580 [bacterium]|nr:MAG: hypothetical protein DRQ36_01580 [bacterium]